MNLTNKLLENWKSGDNAIKYQRNKNLYHNGWTY